MTRTGCALGCLAWIGVMSLPVLAFILATQGELAWRRGPNNLVEDRLFLINEPEAAGLGYASARVNRDDTATAGPLCVQTRVVYLLWRNAEGQDQNTAFCECYTRSADGEYEYNGVTCQEPSDP